jgi:hypothetical protein
VDQRAELLKKGEDIIPVEIERKIMEEKEILKTLDNFTPLNPVFLRAQVLHNVHL